MKFCRFDDDRIGVVRDGLVHDVSAITEKLPAIRYPFPPGDALVANLGGLRDDMESLADGVPGRPVSEVRLLSPVANPTKIIGTPQNYEAHAEEATADHQISGGRGRRPTADQAFLQSGARVFR